MGILYCIMVYHTPLSSTFPSVLSSQKWVPPPRCTVFLGTPYPVIQCVFQCVFRFLGAYFLLYTPLSSVFGCPFWVYPTPLSILLCILLYTPYNVLYGYPLYPLCFLVCAFLFLTSKASRYTPHATVLATSSDTFTRSDPLLNRTPCISTRPAFPFP
jgi:hypothetical protein